MPKTLSILSKLALISLLAFAHPAVAATPDSTSTNEDPINQELLNSELGSDEAPPPAEYPYPGAKEEGITSPTASQASAQEPSAPLANVERPIKIDEETGDYHYDTNNIVKETPKVTEGERAPETVKDNGEYIYGTEEHPANFSNRNGVEKPASILANGEFKYATQRSPLSGSASFRVGMFGPPSLVNTSFNPHKFFQDIYTKISFPFCSGNMNGHSRKESVTSVSSSDLEFSLLKAQVNLSRPIPLAARTITRLRNTRS